MRGRNDNFELERWLSIIFALLFLLPFVARGQETTKQETPGYVKMDDVQSGTLLLKTSQHGLYLPATTVSTGVEIRVTGIIARAKVTQQFHNPTTNCVEGIYVFPLPENAAVDQMHLVIGDRKIDGEIREREDARQEYEQAKAEGRKASLLEQERPNIFTVSVSGILPGEDAQVEIEYQQTLRYDNGAFSLRFPTTIGPRYTPAHAASTAMTASSASAVPESFPNAETSLRPSDGLRNPISIKVDLDPGSPLDEVISGKHRINTTMKSDNRYTVALADADVPSDRDFELTWKPRLGSAPHAAAFAENANGEHYLLLMLVPPTTDAIPVRIPRETVFIIDTSGSMEGTSLQQAKQALLLGLDHMQPGDRFNVIQFNSVFTQIFDSPQPADSGAISRAKTWVGNLESTGGTEMYPALDAALSQIDRSFTGIGQIIFMTDGDVSNESELFDLIGKKLGSTRLFTVGIGSAPNSHFMSSAARLGRGTFTYVGNVNEVQQKMSDLFSKIESPVLSDLSVDFGDPNAEVAPSLISDLYAGEPLIVSARVSQIPKSVRVHGRLGDRDYTEDVSIATGSDESGIAKLWARRKIESLSDSTSRGANAETVRSEVTKVALANHLVSEFTSLVAVDHSDQALLGQPRCQVELIPVNLPDGWGGEKGSLPQTGTPSTLLLVAGALLIMIAALLKIAS